MSNNIFQLRLHYELHGQNCENGYWFHGTTTCINDPYPTILDELIALMTQFDVTVRPKIQTWMCDDCHFQRLDGVCKDPAFGPVHTITYTSLGGLQGNDALPGFNAGVLSLRTGFSGRQNRGRSYYGGVPEDFSQSGLLSVESLSDLDDIGQELMLRFGPQTTNPCWRYMLFHQTAFNNGTPLQNALSFITEIVPRREIRSMRKRMLGHGA